MAGVVKSVSVNGSPNTSEVDMVGVRLIGITKSDNGDALYELALTPAAQEAIFKKSKKRK